MANAGGASEAFGLEGGGPSSMPTAETSATGIKGYSTGKEYDDMISKSLSPALQEAINKFFIDRNAGRPKTALAQSGGKTGISSMHRLANQMNLGNSMGIERLGDGK